MEEFSKKAQRLAEKTTRNASDSRTPITANSSQIKSSAITVHGKSTQGPGTAWRSPSLTSIPAGARVDRYLSVTARHSPSLTSTPAGVMVDKHLYATARHSLSHTSTPAGVMVDKHLSAGVRADKHLPATARKSLSRTSTSAGVRADKHLSATDLLVARMISQSSSTLSQSADRSPRLPAASARRMSISRRSLTILTC